LDIEGPVTDKIGSYKMNGKPLCVAQFYLSAGASKEQI
jgi:hypothetical protein